MRFLSRRRAPGIIDDDSKIFGFYPENEKHEKAPTQATSPQGGHRINLHSNEFVNKITIFVRVFLVSCAPDGCDPISFVIIALNGGAHQLPAARIHSKRAGGISVSVACDSIWCIHE